MADTFEQGWAARPFKKQFPELSNSDAQKLDEINEAITLLSLTDMLTNSQFDAIRSKRFPKMVSRLVHKARREATQQQEGRGDE